MTQKKKPLHDLESIALGYARCVCKWEFRIENYKDKTDEDLSIETGTAFDDHKNENETL